MRHYRPSPGLCDECDEQVLVRCSWCSRCVDCCECDPYQEELFDADELGLDPELDDVRRYGA